MFQFSTNPISSFRSAEETFSMADESCGLNPAMIRRKKIAISIIFSLPENEEAQKDFQDFFFSHFPLFESHMGKLKNAVEMVKSNGSHCSAISTTRLAKNDVSVRSPEELHTQAFECRFPT